MSGVPSRTPNALQRLLRRGKDATIETAARVALNSRLSGIAEICELSLDTERRCVRVMLHLCGEHEALEVRVHRYRLREKYEAPQIAIGEVTASREWLENALKQFVVGRWIEIPPALRTALEMLT